MERFNVGDIVEMRYSREPTRGRVVVVRDHGNTIVVRWERRRGFDEQGTTEAALDLRKVPR
jgi:hypothetical protein